ncbi:MAG: hypothetical protein LCI00_16020 [Chloroflexi bacterium]|nr:hypothetical protein [Chloroflexota bacterium]MCC6892738.1 PD40 domain-containing protein [Anaerolineae bacterium]
MSRLYNNIEQSDGTYKTIFKCVLLCATLLLTASFAHAQDATPTTAPVPVLAYLQGDGTHCSTAVISSVDGLTQQPFELPVVSGCMSPVWSPDGAYLAIYYPGMMLIEAETGEITVLNDLSAGTVVDTAVWSAQGGYLAWHEQGGGDGANPTWNVLDVEAGTVETVSDLGEVDIAPDSIELLRSENGGLYLVASGQAPLNVPLPEALDCTSSLALFGNQFVCHDGNDLVLVDMESGTLLNLTNTPTVQETNGQWSPDGGQIVYQTYEPNTLKTWINTIRPDGTNGLQLTLPDGDAYDVRPRWSPDGTMIAFQRHSGPKGLMTEVFVIRADGSGEFKVGDGLEAVWQPMG